jgi:heme O synthase-like polyprenyltransferase
MKELNEEQLLKLCEVELKKMKNHNISCLIFSIILFVQAFLLLFGYLPITIYLIIFGILMLLYYFHDWKFKKADKKLKEILDELDNRV